METVAATIWPEPIAQSPWADQSDFQESYVRGQDRNGEGSLCMKTTSGDEYDPKSHWSGVFFFVFTDSTSNGSHN